MGKRLAHDRRIMREQQSTNGASWEKQVHNWASRGKTKRTIRTSWGKSLHLTGLHKKTSAQLAYHGGKIDQVGKNLRIISKIDGTWRKLKLPRRSFQLFNITLLFLFLILEKKLWPKIEIEAKKRFKISL